MTSPVLPVYSRAPVTFIRGEGVWLQTQDGERYLDFGSGVAVMSLGHSHPRLVSALVAQAEKLWHTSNLYQMPGQERVAARLVANSFADTVFFANSGAEALECAIKMARKFHAAQGHGERYRIITFEGAFHGRTLATLAAGGQAKYLDGFGPKVDGFDQVPFGSRAAVEAAITPETAAILIEPVQGEGGVKPVPADDLRFLRSVCDAHGLLLIFDEVQTGVGRTGKLFAHELSGVTPDIMALAKGLGGGFPVGACLATARAACGMGAGSHASTFGGNHLGMAVVEEVLDIILEEGFLEGVRQRSLVLKQKLARLKDEHPAIIAQVRGEGLMMGLQTHVPNTDLQKAAMAEKLITIPAGDNVVRLVPPLVISDLELDEAINRLDRACRALEGTMKKEGRS